MKTNLTTLTNNCPICRKPYAHTLGVMGYAGPPFWCQCPANQPIILPTKEDKLQIKDIIPNKLSISLEPDSNKKVVLLYIPNPDVHYHIDLSNDEAYKLLVWLENTRFDWP